MKCFGGLHQCFDQGLVLYGNEVTRRALINLFPILDMSIKVQKMGPLTLHHLFFIPGEATYPVIIHKILKFA